MLQREVAEPDCTFTVNKLNKNTSLNKAKILATVGISRKTYFRFTPSWIWWVLYSSLQCISVETENDTFAFVLQCTCLKKDDENDNT